MKQTESLERDIVVLEARAWLGTPFQHGQRVRGAGVDCAQLLVACYADTGITADCRPPEYAPLWFLHRGESPLLAVLEQHCHRLAIDPSRALRADILTFRFGRAESHAAIATEWPHIIHADRGPARRVRHDALIAGSPLAARIAGVWRPKQWEQP